MKVRRGILGGEPIREYTWLHVGDTLLSIGGARNRRVVVIERILYNDDMTVSYLLAPLSKVRATHKRKGFHGSKEASIPMRYRTLVHERTVREHYSRLSTGEVKNG